MLKYHFLCLILLFRFSLSSQNWKLKLSSNVELRTWKLNDRVDKQEKALAGASIRLLNGSSVVSEVSSKSNGDFTIEVPPNGDYMMEVSYAGCNTKRFAVSTKGVPGEVGNSGFNPSYSIGGFILSRPLPGIDYAPLKDPLLKVYYIDGAKKFDNDEDVTDRGLRTVSKLATAETDLVGKFCAFNRAGDDALAKNDCPLAKSNYEKAIALIQGEAYPATQLSKVADCLKQKENSDKKAVDDAVAKVAADKAAREQQESDKLVKAQAEAARKQAEKEKAAEAKKKKEEPVKEASAATPKEPAAAAVQTPTVKGGIKIKPKSPDQLEEEAKDAKRREGMAKSAQEDRDAIEKDKEKAKEDYKKRQEKEAERRQKEREGKAAAEAEIIKEDREEAAKKEENRQKELQRKEEAEAKNREEEKEEAAKREEKRQKQREEEEKQRQEELEERRKASENRELQEGDYQVPQPLGGDKYKDAIKSADELFKMKRYSEARKKYEEALTYKAGDAYATSKLNEIATKTQPK